MIDEVREEFFDRNDVRYFHALCCSAHVTKAARYVAFSSLLYFFIKAVPILAHWTPIGGILLALELLSTWLLMCAIWQEVRLLLIPYLIHQAICIVINSFEIGVWILELAYALQVDLRLMERSIVFVKAPEYFNNKHYEIKDEPVYARPLITAEDKIRVLLFIFSLSAALAVSIYFFRIVINFYHYLERRPILLDNQKAIQSISQSISQSEQERASIVPHRK